MKQFKIIENIAELENEHSLPDWLFQQCLHRNVG
jgi:hypothetical protein